MISCKRICTFLLCVVLVGCSKPYIIEYSEHWHGNVPKRVFVVGYIGDELGKDRDKYFSYLTSNLNDCNSASEFAFAPIQKHTLSLEDDDNTQEDIILKKMGDFKPDYILRITRGSYHVAGNPDYGTDYIESVNYLIVLVEPSSKKEIWHMSMELATGMMIHSPAQFANGITEKMQQAGIFSVCKKKEN